MTYTCPKCTSTDKLMVENRVWCHVFQGPEEDNIDVDVGECSGTHFEFDDASPALCPNCHWIGRIGDCT